MDVPGTCQWRTCPWRVDEGAKAALHVLNRPPAVLVPQLQRVAASEAVEEVGRRRRRRRPQLVHLHPIAQQRHLRSLLKEVVELDVDALARHLDDAGGVAGACEALLAHLDLHALAWLLPREGHGAGCCYRPHCWPTVWPASCSLSRLAASEERISKKEKEHGTELALKELASANSLSQQTGSTQGRTDVRSTAKPAHQVYGSLRTLSAVPA